MDSANDVDPSSPSSPATTGAERTGANAVSKRYRPIPAKTFQCRGYGECRMVFSRSEHLARHIRYDFPSKLDFISIRNAYIHPRSIACMRLNRAYMWFKCRSLFLRVSIVPWFLTFDPGFCWIYVMRDANAASSHVGNIPANVHSPVIVGSSSRGSITFDSMLRRFMRISKSLMSR